MLEIRSPSSTENYAKEFRMQSWLDLVTMRIFEVISTTTYVKYKSNKNTNVHHN